MRTLKLSATNVKALELVRDQPGVDLAGLAKVLLPGRSWNMGGRRHWPPTWLIAVRMTRLRRLNLVFYKFRPDPVKGPFEGTELPKKCWYLSDEGFEICEQYQLNAAASSSDQDRASREGDGAGA